MTDKNVILEEALSANEKWERGNPLGAILEEIVAPKMAAEIFSEMAKTKKINFTFRKESFVDSGLAEKEIHKRLMEILGANRISQVQSRKARARAFAELKYPLSRAINGVIDTKKYHVLIEYLDEKRIICRGGSEAEFLRVSFSRR